MLYSFEQANQITDNASEILKFYIPNFSSKRFKFTNERIYFHIAFYLLLRMRFGDDYIKEKDIMCAERYENKKLYNFGQEIKAVSPEKLINSHGFFIK